MSDSLKDTIEPNIDQLNADALADGPMTITITKVVKKSSDQQPVEVHIQGMKDTPYKPCKGMRSVMIQLWGDTGYQEWGGRQMTLFRNPDVKFKGERVGGIEISHMSHIERPSMTVKIRATRGIKRDVTIKRIDTEQPKPTQQTQQPASEISDKQIAELRARLAKHIPSDGDRKTYVLETLGIKGNPTLGASWTLEQYATATMFCDEMEGPV